MSMNVSSELTCVLSMLAAATRRDHTLAHVIPDTLEMVPLVMTLTNVLLVSTIVMPTPPVPTAKVTSVVLVMLASPDLEPVAPTSMNA